jgi:hypothetical protein
MKKITFSLACIILVTLACEQATPTPMPVDHYSLLPEVK